MIIGDVRQWRVRGALAVGGVVVAAGTVAGCTSSSVPALPSPTPSATGSGVSAVASTVSAVASPSASPSASVSAVARPVLPEAAKQATRAGAEAFFRYFFAAYDYAYQFSDSSVVADLSDTSCTFCRSVQERIAENKNLGITRSGGQTTVIAVAASPGEPKTGLVVVAAVRQSELKVYDKAGTLLSTESPQPERRVDARVRWSGSAWTLVALRVLPVTKPT